MENIGEHLENIGDYLENYWRNFLFWSGLDRNSDGTIANIPDGIIFPILAAFSEFVVQGENGWTIETPRMFYDSDIIDEQNLLI